MGRYQHNIVRSLYWKKSERKLALPRGINERHKKNHDKKVERKIIETREATLENQNEDD